MSAGGEPRAKRARGHPFALSIQPALPRYPFVDTYFNVSVCLVDETNSVKGGEDVDIPLQVRLLADKATRTPAPAELLDVNPPEPVVGRSGKVNFQVRIRESSKGMDAKPFALEISPAPSASRLDVASVTSGPLTVIRHRLRIRPESQPPAVWYKDEGGRDKCIEITVDLVDAEGRRVQGQEVPVKVMLLYEDQNVVLKQDILKLSADSRQAIDESGSAILRLRIEDVSKNHQSKGFVIRVGPDTLLSPSCADISPDISTSISVRSKRNRRQRQGGRVDDDPTLVGHAIARAPGDVPLPVPTNPLVEGGLGRPGGDAKGAADASSPVLKSLSNVISWTRSVVNGLYQIQWQLIGYESKPDGSPDISRPLFNIQNPNNVVTNILQSYRNETMEQLRFLVQALESGNLNAQQGGGSFHPPGGFGGEAGHNTSHGDGLGDSSLGAHSEGSMGAHAHEPPFAGGGAGGFAQGGAPGRGTNGFPSPARNGPSLSSSGNPSMPPLLPRAALSRVRSGLYPGADGNSEVMSMVPLVRESTFDLLAAMDPSWFGIDLQQSEPPAIAAEAQVYAVVAKIYYSNAFGELGFPSFDHKHGLLGFYREGRNEQGQTMACYVPLPPGFSEAEKAGVSDMLKQEMEGSSGAVFTIADNDVANLKERVLTYHWSRSQTYSSGGSEGERPS